MAVTVNYPGLLSEIASLLTFPNGEGFVRDILSKGCPEEEAGSFDARFPEWWADAREAPEWVWERLRVSVGQRASQLQARADNLTQIGKYLRGEITTLEQERLP